MNTMEGKEQASKCANAKHKRAAILLLGSDNLALSSKALIAKTLTGEPAIKKFLSGAAFFPNFSLRGDVFVRVETRLIQRRFQSLVASFSARKQQEKHRFTRRKKTVFFSEPFQALLSGDL